MGNPYAYSKQKLIVFIAAIALSQLFFWSSYVWANHSSNNFGPANVGPRSGGWQCVDASEDWCPSPSDSFYVSIWDYGTDYQANEMEVYGNAYKNGDGGFEVLYCLHGGVFGYPPALCDELVAGSGVIQVPDSGYFYNRGFNIPLADMSGMCCAGARSWVYGTNAFINLNVWGRRVFISSLNAPSNATVGQPFDVTWSTQNVSGNVELLWDGVSFQGRSSPGSTTVNPNDGDTFIPTSPGVVQFSLRAQGPGHYGGVNTVEETITVNVDGAVGTIPGPFSFDAECINGASTDVALAWSSSSGAASYIVERKIWSGGAWGVIASGVTSTNYTDTNPVVTADNYYRVFAINAQGQTISTPSEISVYVTTATCGGSPPPPPTSPPPPPPSPPPGSCSSQNNAQFVGWTPPPGNMSPGQSANVSVTMRNTGVTTWNYGTHSLGSQNPQDNLSWGLARVSLPGSYVAPGENVTFNFTVTAPQNTGTYGFQWRMVKDEAPGCWFGDYTPNHNVNVVGAPVWVEHPVCAEGPTYANIRWDPIQVSPLTIPGWPYYYVDVSKVPSFGWYWNEAVWSPNTYSADAAAGFDCSGLAVDGCDPATLPSSEPATPVILGPNIDYYARIFAGSAPQHYPNNSPGIHFKIPYCNPPPQKPRIIAPNCSDGPYSFTLDWSESSPSSIQGYYMDVSNNIGFSPFYNRQIPAANPLSSTPDYLDVNNTDPAQFTGPWVNGASQGNPFGLFYPNTNYYFRAYNAQWSLTSDVLNVPSCSTVVNVTTPDGNSGNAPYTVPRIRATVGGNTTGNITYALDCGYDGNYQYDNGTVVSVSSTNDFVNACTYSAPGTYYPNVRITRQGDQATDPTPPSVSVNAAPIIGSVTADIATSYCQSGPNVIVGWTVVSGGPQTGYRVQIDDDPMFGSPAIDTSHIVSTSTNYSPDAATASQMLFNTVYRTRVKVWSALGESAWTSMSSCTGTGCSAGTNWRTPLHPYPYVLPFTWTPPAPARGVPIQFTDETVFDSASVAKSWFWNFGDGDTSVLQNPIKTYGDFGNYVVTLTVRDNATLANSESCSYANSAFNIAKPVPEWREVLPR